MNLKEEIKEMTNEKLIMFALAHLLRKSQDGYHITNSMANELELRRVTNRKE
jgi:hypothetical protein